MIKDLLEHEGTVADNFMVKSVEKGMSNAAKPYLTVVLQDMTGTIEAKKWEIGDDDLDIIVPGAIIGVRGGILKYKGKPQLKINSVERVDSGLIDRALYVPTAPLKLAEIEKQVKEFVAQIQDADIKKVVTEIIEENWPAYSSYPAAVTVHEAYEAGLIFHSLSVCKVALAIATLYPDLFHKDYVIAGTLLHDIGKIWELSGIVQTKYTRIGKLEGHLHIGAMLINQKCAALKVDQETTDLLTHIILSHHGIPEYGSPVMPKTADAFLVHLADDTDAKVCILQQYLAQAKPGEFTMRIPWMDGIEVYNPKLKK